jgi:transmembrane sensor
MSADDIEAQAAHWLTRRDGEDWSDALQAELDAWIGAAVSHRVAWLRLSCAWQRADRLAAVAPAPMQAQAQRLPPAVTRWRIAAGVLLACGVGWFAAALMPPPWQEPPAQRYATAVGESKTALLADGTRLTLNTGTGLRARIGGSKREVWLDKGEAFFDVAPDKAHPFIVDAGRSRITVVGTRFSVRREGQAVTVLVAEGKVRVDQGESRLTLVRNDSAQATEGRLVMSTRTPAQLNNLLGWREGRLVLDDLTLGQAAAEFNRYNRRQLVIEDAAVARMAIGGSFAPTNVEGFARLLQQGFGLRVRSGPDQILISR